MLWKLTRSFGKCFPNHPETAIYGSFGKYKSDVYQRAGFWKMLLLLHSDTKEKVGEDMEKDHRLNAFKKEWFENQDCLDFGCNNGSLTIQLAKKFGCNSILGLDIDGVLIQNAFRNLRKTARTTTESTLTNFVSEEKDLSGIVTFEEGNFVDWRPPEDKCYHTILCLSVSKWIHLNWGDGLITLFSKIWKHLHPSGIFILEPQPWDSYSSNRHKSNVTRTNYRDIKIYPDTFQEILLDKVGFRKV